MKIGNIDLEEFKSGKIAVNCVSEDDAREFLRGLHDYGIKWYSGKSCLEKISNISNVSKNCYNVTDGMLTGTVIGYYEKIGYKIIKYEGEKEMKFSDLKDNWVVMFRNGIIGVSFEKIIHCETDNKVWNFIDKTLKHYVDENYDIIKVWSTDNGEMTLVWERKEPTEKELALQQIAELKQKVAELEKSVEGMK